MEQVKTSRPLSVKLTVWWAYIFAAMYLLYGGVKLVLSILDRQYAEMDRPFIFMLVGILLIVVAMAYRDSKPWGWIGVVVLNGLIILMAIFNLEHAENIVLMVLALLALVGLFLPSTKAYVFDGR